MSEVQALAVCAATMDRLAREKSELVAALGAARFALVEWGGYVPDYFQKKHDLATDIARIDAAISKATEAQP